MKHFMRCNIQDISIFNSNKFIITFHLKIHVHIGIGYKIPFLIGYIDGHKNYILTIGFHCFSICRQFQGVGFSGSLVRA